MTADACEIAMADDREAQYLRMLDEHGSALRRLARSYEADPARREDLVQDICLALWQALPGFRGECSARTFAFRIAHNRSVSHVIRARRRATDPLDAASTASDLSSDPELHASRQQRRDRLLAAVQSLPLGPRQVIVLTLEGLTQREIGEVLGLTENAVAVRMTRARKTLAGLLQPSEDRS